MQNDDLASKTQQNLPALRHNEVCVSFDASFRDICQSTSRRENDIHKEVRAIVQVTEMDDAQVLARIERGQGRFLLEAKSEESRGLLEVSPVFTRVSGHWWKRFFVKPWTGLRGRDDLYVFNNSTSIVQVLNHVSLRGKPGAFDELFEFGDAYVESEVSATQIANYLGLTDPRWVAESRLEGVCQKYGEYVARELEESDSPFEEWHAEYRRGNP